MNQFLTSVLQRVDIRLHELLLSAVLLHLLLPPLPLLALLFLLLLSPLLLLRTRKIFIQSNKPARGGQRQSLQSPPEPPGVPADLEPYVSTDPACSYWNTC